MALKDGHVQFSLEQHEHRQVPEVDAVGDLTGESGDPVAQQPVEQPGRAEGQWQQQEQHRQPFQQVFDQVLPGVRHGQVQRATERQADQPVEPTGECPAQAGRSRPLAEHVA